MIFIVKNFCTDRQKPIFPPVFAGPRDRATRRPFRLRKKKAGRSRNKSEQKIYIRIRGIFCSIYTYNGYIKETYHAQKDKTVFYLFHALFSDRLAVRGFSRGCRLSVGIFQPGRTFRSVLYHLRHRRADPARSPWENSKRKNGISEEFPSLPSSSFSVSFF